MVKRFNAAPGLIPELDVVLRSEQVVEWNGVNLATRLGVGNSARALLVPMVIKDKVSAAVYVDASGDSARTFDPGWQDDLITPFRGLERDNNLRADSSLEKLAKLKPVFGKGEAATMTAANSTPLTDGASAVLLGPGMIDTEETQALASEVEETRHQLDRQEEETLTSLRAHALA